MNERYEEREKRCKGCKYNKIVTDRQYTNAHLCTKGHPWPVVLMIKCPNGDFKNDIGK